MAVIACLSCTAELVVNDDRGASNIVIRESGYEMIVRTNCSMAWLCPACTTKAVPHIQALVNLFRHEGEEIYWGCLPSLLKRQLAKVELGVAK